MNLRENQNQVDKLLKEKDLVLAELGIDIGNEKEGFELCKEWRKKDKEKYKEQIGWVDEEQKKIVNEFKETKSSITQHTDNKDLNPTLKAPEIPDFNIVMGSEWFEKFKKDRLEPMAEKYKNGKDIFDPNIRRLCYIHAQAILLHYGKDHCGNLINYLKALKFMNNWLDGVYTSYIGYFSAVRETKKIPEAEAIAMEGNTPIIDEETTEEFIPLLQVKCDAEQDFAALIHFYVKKLFVNDEHPSFSATSLNTIANQYRKEDYISSYLEQKILAYRYAVYKHKMFVYKNALYLKKIQEAISESQLKLNRLNSQESSFNELKDSKTSDAKLANEDLNPNEDQAHTIVSDKENLSSDDEYDMVELKPTPEISEVVSAYSTQPQMTDLKDSNDHTLEETVSSSQSVILTEEKETPIAEVKDTQKPVKTDAINSSLAADSIVEKIYQSISNKTAETPNATEVKDTQHVTVLMPEVKDNQPTVLSEVKDNQPTILSAVKDDKSTVLSAVTDNQPTVLSAVKDDQSTVLSAVKDDQSTVISAVTDNQPTRLSDAKDNQSTVLSEVKDNQPTSIMSETKEAQPHLASILSKENSELQSPPIIQETKQAVAHVAETENTEQKIKSSDMKQTSAQAASLKFLSRQEQSSNDIHLNQNKQQEFKEFYYEQYKIYKDTRKYFGLGAAKIQRALFCAAAAILANTNYANECYQFIYQQIESKDSNHKALAQALCTMIMSTEIPVVVKPFHYIKEISNTDNDLMQAWKSACTRPSFKELLALEDNISIESLVSNKPVRSLLLTKHFIDGTKKERMLIETTAAILSNSGNSAQLQEIINEQLKSSNFSNRKLAEELNTLIKNRNHYGNMKPFEILSKQQTKFIRSAWHRVQFDKKIRAAIDNEKNNRLDAKPSEDNQNGSIGLFQKK